MKNNLCISHNDYKPKNILWSQDSPILIDFDAMGLVNHACALSESAFTFSNLDTNINYDYYKLYLKEYISVYGPFKEDYRKALYVSMNGKIRWYVYLLSKNDKKYKNKNIYILPSSVHEVILLAEDASSNKKDLLSMVTEINATQVDECEVLADSVYFYDLEEDRLKRLC